MDGAGSRYTILTQFRPCQQARPGSPPHPFYAMNRPKLKLLFIGGYSRCGSTILSNVLGEIDGFLNGGELMFIWDRIRSENGLCGCGAHVCKCEIWSRVIRTAFGGPEKLDCDQLIATRDREWTSTNLAKWLYLPGSRARLEKRIGDYLGHLEKLYAAIATELPGTTIIDSSKNPAYLYFLSLIPGLEIHVVHIVRDARANAYSWLAPKDGFVSKRPVESSLSWNARNLILDRAGARFGDRYMRVKYEEFVQEPKACVENILQHIGATGKDLSYMTPDGVMLKRNHCVYGNPDLFKSGKIQLKLDERWKAMTKGDKLVATTLTWPFMKRYGY